MSMAVSRWGMSASVVRVHEFFNTITPIALSSDMKGIGLLRDERMVAGVLFEGFNGVNVWMHVAAEPGARWMTREYLRYCFQYPFMELGVQRISGYVNASNDKARRFNEHLGFEREAVLQGAAPDGGDVWLYVMRREQCRFISGM